jgi:hypothetical protein
LRHHRVPLVGTYSNPKHQATALEALLGELPGVDAPLPRSVVQRKPGRARQLDEERVRQLIAGYEGGSTLARLADRFLIDRRTVSVILKRHGVRIRQRGLSAGQVAEAARLRAAGWTFARIGERLGVGGTTARRRLLELRRAEAGCEGNEH